MVEKNDGTKKRDIRAAAPEWTPDGSRIIFGHGGGIYAVSQDGSELNRIHGSDGEIRHSPYVSGDGSLIWYSKHEGGDYAAEWGTAISALDGSDERTPPEDFAAWVANHGRGWWYRSSGVSPDVSRAVFVKTEIRGDKGKYVTILYVSEHPRGEDRFGWVKLAEGDGIGSPRWSPDGSRIAFVESSGVPNDDDSLLYSTRVVSPNGSNLETVYQAAGSCSRHACVGHEVAWSPDGTKLLISGSSSISVVNADGSGLKTLVKLQDNPIRQLHPSWSPDGSKIAVYNGNAYEGVLFTMSPDGSDKRALAEYGDPLRLAQDQSWDPAFDATPTPTPSPSATPRPVPATAAPSPPAKPRAPVSTPTPAHGIAPPTTRADAPGGAKDPRIVRNAGGFDPTTPIRGGAVYGHTRVPTEAVHVGRGLFRPALIGYAELAHVVSS